MKTTKRQQVLRKGLTFFPINWRKKNNYPTITDFKVEDIIREKPDVHCVKEQILLEEYEGAESFDNWT